MTLLRQSLQNIDNSTSYMAIGDLIEFLSDKQTDKGPSSGYIVDVDKDEDTGTSISIYVDHSDVKRDIFHLSHLKVNKKVIREDGKTLWVCE